MTPRLPYFQDEQITLYHAACQDILPLLPPVDLILTDPPYGETSLSWDQTVDNWTPLLNLKPSASIWCFGSFRFWLERAAIDFANWKYSQEIIWEKHNGTNNANDRFRRVHELCVQWYRGQWEAIYKEPQFTLDAVRKSVRRKQQPPKWWGEIKDSTYLSHDGGPRLARSVIYSPSCHGTALHPTQKPLAIVTPLLLYSCPPNGTVLDPFAGSGTTLLAAKYNNRHAIGIEAREDYCYIITQRLAQAPLL